MVQRLFRIVARSGHEVWRFYIAVELRRLVAK